MINKAIKKQFPIFGKYKDLVYLDNAATTQKPLDVIESICKYYRTSNANVHRGIYKLSEEATAEYEEARETMQKFLNAKSAKEIIFTSGTTDSINKFARSLPNINHNDVILTTVLDHHSNILPWQKIAQDNGATLEFIPLKTDYSIDLEKLKEIIKKKPVKIIAIQHASNVTGNKNPIKEIAQMAHKKNIIVAVDGAQTAAHVPIDVQDLEVDFYALSGHKMYGPTGIGIAWAKKSLLEEIEPFAYGGGMIELVGKDKSTWAELPEKHEAGTPNIAGAIGLAQAAKFIENIGIEHIYRHDQHVATYLIEELSNLDGAKIHASEKNVGVVSFEIDGVHPHDIAQYLDTENIALRAGHHCCQIFHRDILKTSSTIRASIGVYNDTEDVDKLIISLNKIIRTFRK